MADSGDGAAVHALRLADGDAMSYEKDDPTFIADLLASERLVLKTANWLRSKGQTVTIPPVRVRPKIEQMREFADSGDLMIVVPGDPPRLDRVEVKGRKLTFTSRDDYPFPTVIVDVAHTWDRAETKPRAYVIFNSAETYAAIVKADTADRWVKTERFDVGKKRMRTFYECPVALVEFIQFKYLSPPPPINWEWLEDIGRTAFGIVYPTPLRELAEAEERARKKP